MQPAVMAEEVTTVPDEPGAPIPKDAIDPALVKLSRSRPRIGMVTAAGVMFLCLYFAWKLNPDRRFSGEPEAPTRVTVEQIANGSIGPDRHVVVDAEPLIAHAIRSATQKGNFGMRVVPARGSADKLWLVLSGDGWSEAITAGHVGRLRPLADMPIADSIESFLAANPRPMFAPASAVRSGFVTNKVSTVAGDTVAVRESDRVGFDVLEPALATVICSFGERHPNTAACSQVLADLGITVSGPPQEGREQTRYTITAPDAVATTRTALESAQMWSMIVEPVTKHYETTWGKLKTSGPAGFTVDAVTLPDTQLDLIGLYVVRSIPDGAYALLGGEKPQDYWYVLPVTILVIVIGLLFAWALVRAVKRDLLPTRAA